MYCLCLYKFSRSTILLLPHIIELLYYQILKNLPTCTQVFKYQYIMSKIILNIFGVLGQEYEAFFIK